MNPDIKKLLKKKRIMIPLITAGLGLVGVTVAPEQVAIVVEIIIGIL